MRHAPQVFRSRAAGEVKLICQGTASQAARVSRLLRGVNLSLRGEKSMVSAAGVAERSKGAGQRAHESLQSRFTGEIRADRRR